MTTGPRWWQRLIPRYGNWGGPGWSGGKWCPPNETDWSVKPVDNMDAAFARHDMGYQAPFIRNVDADRDLVSDLKAINVRGVWANIYRVGAILIFTIKGWS